MALTPAGRRLIRSSAPPVPETVNWAECGPSVSLSRYHYYTDPFPRTTVAEALAARPLNCPVLVSQYDFLPLGSRTPQSADDITKMLKAVLAQENEIHISEEFTLTDSEQHMCHALVHGMTKYLERLHITSDRLPDLSQIHILPLTIESLAKVQRHLTPERPETWRDLGITLGRSMHQCVLPYDLSLKEFVGAVAHEMSHLAARNSLRMRLTPVTEPLFVRSGLHWYVLGEHRFRGLNEALTELQSLLFRLETIALNPQLQHYFSTQQECLEAFGVMRSYQSQLMVFAGLTTHLAEHYQLEPRTVVQHFQRAYFAGDDLVYSMMGNALSPETYMTIAQLDHWPSANAIAAAHALDRPDIAEAIDRDDISLLEGFLAPLIQEIVSHPTTT